MQTIEERLDQLEKRNRRLTAALAVLTVAMCAVVMMAATGEKDGRFDTLVANAVWADTVMAENILVKKDAGKPVVGLAVDDAGYGVVMTLAPSGKTLVVLGATRDDTGGSLRVFNKTGEDVVHLGVDEYGNGVVGAYNRKGMGKTLKPGP